MLGLLEQSPEEFLRPLSKITGVVDVTEEDDSSASSSEQLKQKIDIRLAFIRDKNWAEADRIRDELLAQGIQLKDGKDPATGERVTTWEVKR